MKESKLKATQKAPTQPKKVETEKKLITLTGITTSKVWERKKLSDTPAYCFLKTDEREEDIPVIFRIKYEKNSCQFHSECPWYCNEKGSWIKPTIRKGSCLQVQGHFTNSDKERKSFTATSYTLLACPHSQKKPYHCPVDCLCEKGQQLKAKEVLKKAQGQLPYLQTQTGIINQRAKDLSHDQ